MIATVAGALALGIVLPFTPLAGRSDSCRRRPPFLGFVALVTVGCLACVELVKGPLMARLGA